MSFKCELHGQQEETSVGCEILKETRQNDLRSRYECLLMRLKYVSAELQCARFSEGKVLEARHMDLRMARPVNVIAPTAQIGQGRCPTHRS
jgi:hypothetical protein